MERVNVDVYAVAAGEAVAVPGAFSHQPSFESTTAPSPVAAAALKNLTAVGAAAALVMLTG